MKSAKLRNPAELKQLRDHLRSALDERDLLPAELAAKAVIPLPSITRILNGQVRNPGIDLVISLAKGLGKSVSDLVGDQSPPSVASSFALSGRSGLEVVLDFEHDLDVAEINALLGHESSGDMLRAICALECDDRIGVLNTLTTITVNEGVNIAGCFGTTRDGKARVVLIIESDQRTRLERTVQRISEAEFFDITQLRTAEQPDDMRILAILDQEENPEPAMLANNIVNYLNPRSKLERRAG